MAIISITSRFILLNFMFLLCFFKVGSSNDDNPGRTVKTDKKVTWTQCKCFNFRKIKLKVRQIPLCITCHIPTTYPPLTYHLPTSTTYLPPTCYLLTNYLTPTYHLLYLSPTCHLSATYLTPSCYLPCMWNCAFFVTLRKISAKIFVIIKKNILLN